MHEFSLFFDSANNFNELYDWNIITRVHYTFVEQLQFSVGLDRIHENENSQLTLMQIKIHL